ncbi:hypothetical protein Belba_1141 [Belliella baltica DSM 15883]|uniref:DUF4221 domain-containing protein n=1 Tax=Belliella baltica (strain DSM 15883 / CIP 108006 / LMG 21964 / BA134) TaxID=866536 RepID=I3Z3F9_BELBD|nr:DUF4221 family protein [Belliella baltica]AFL83777.1 hypothetical protein Belba_1141 [Belliella baltica DSM 15883]
MKKTIIGMISGLVLISACSTEKSESLENFEFDLTQDTVMVDAGDEIINLQYGLSSPELSKDGKYLFNYIFNQPKFDKINLETLNFEETLEFEREGPNGIGNYVAGYALTDKDQIMMWSYGLHAIFDQNGEKVKDLNLDKIAGDEVGGSGYLPLRLIEHPEDSNIIFGLYVKWENYEYFLMKFDLLNESFEKIPLPETERLKEFRMDIESDGRPAGGFGPSPRPLAVDKRIIMTNIAFNEAYVYDMVLDSLYLIPWNSNLTGNKNEAKLPKKVEVEESGKYRNLFMESINFGPLSWDPISQQFIRISYKSTFGEELDEYGDLKVIDAEVFLTLIDKNLAIIKETKLDNYKKEPSGHFFLNNTIWLYENIDDELGFVRVKLD